jgi:hypothetical protein
MPDNNDIGGKDLLGTGVLSIAVVALARGLEFLIGKFRAADTPQLKTLSDRVHALELQMAGMSVRGPINDERFREVLKHLNELDTKLDRLFERSIEVVRR